MHENLSKRHCQIQNLIVLAARFVDEIKNVSHISISEEGPFGGGAGSGIVRDMATVVEGLLFPSPQSDPKPEPAPVSPAPETFSKQHKDIQKKLVLAARFLANINGIANIPDHLIGSDPETAAGEPLDALRGIATEIENFLKN